MPFCTPDSLSNCHDANLNLAFNAAAAAPRLQQDERFHISVSNRVDCDGFRVSVSMADKTPVLRATFSRIADTDEPWPQPRYRFDFAAERSGRNAAARLEQRQVQHSRVQYTQLVREDRARRVRVGHRRAVRLSLSSRRKGDARAVSAHVHGRGRGVVAVAVGHAEAAAQVEVL